MTSSAQQECLETAPVINNKEAGIQNVRLTANQKKKRRKKLSKLKQSCQESNLEETSEISSLERRRKKAAASGSSPHYQEQGPARADLGPTHVCEESSIMTAESNKSSALNMSLWPRHQKQPHCQDYSAPVGHPDRRPAKRQRTGAHSLVLHDDAHPGSPVEQVQQQHLPKGAPAQSADSHVAAASSLSQHSICQDASMGPCQTSRGRANADACSSQTSLAPSEAPAAGAGKAATSLPGASGHQITADVPSHTGGHTAPSNTAQEPGFRCGGKAHESGAYDAVKQSPMRADMSHAAAVIGSSLPGAARHSEGGQQAKDGAAQGVSKRELKRQGFVPVHGNYHRYYGYRIGQVFEEDPRLRVMEKPWFQNRKCLDIGCNEGMVTLGLVTRFGTDSMLGVDIDQILINKACRNLKEEHTRATAELARLSHTRRHLLSIDAGSQTLHTSQNAERKAASAALQGLCGTHFRQANFLDMDGLERGTYDTILCLSVTKWVHLNGGDAALHALLGRIYDLLAPGGRLILEPQPWSSYQAAVHKPGMRERLQPLSSLYLRPEDLPHYATQQFRFTFVRQLRAPENANGFDRPIYLFQKIG
ncbi:g2572 [Coccomyxa elongata]